MTEITVPWWVWTIILSMLAYFAKKMVDRVDARLAGIEAVITSLRDAIGFVDRRHSDNLVELTSRISVIEGRCNARHANN